MTAATHDLITPAAEIPDRGAPDVHKACEREDEKDRHAEEKMRLEDRMHVGDQRRHARLQGENPLSPGHEFHHLMAVEMLERDVDGTEPQDKLGVEQQQNGDIAK